MQDPRLERLGHLLERALSLPPGDRAGFITEAAGEDAALREELASLVEAAEPSSRFFDELASRVGEALAASLSTLPGGAAGDAIRVGDVVAHYEILERIGGGMGVVYRAHDLRLDRPVALKFLPSALAADERARARLYTEARAASALDHPNIGGVYDIAEADPGGLFIVFAWCEGETLKEVLSRGAMPVRDAVGLARQVASALAAAHAAGIVHRDVKPSNIMLSPQGASKLVDFGIARIAGAEPTREGWTPGTVAYMSPEQTRGESVDARTDLWSLGVVLYEMLAGRRPFRGVHDATLVHAIREDEPESLTEVRGDIPTELGSIVKRCLAKETSRRYATADELLAALEELRLPAGSKEAGGGTRALTGPNQAAANNRENGPDAATGGEAEASRLRGHGRTRKLSFAMSGLLLLLLAVAGAFAIARNGVAGPDPAPLDAGETALLAVLPFHVSGPRLAGWGEGVVDLLSTCLDGAAGLRAVDGRTVLARWRGKLGDAREVDLSAALQVARATGARFVVEGSAVAIGRKVRLVARVHDLRTGRRVGTAQVEGSPDTPHALIDDLGVELLRVLVGGEVEDLPRVNLAAVTTTSAEALRAFLEGERHYRAGRWEGAVAAYLHAVQVDSTFALAHHRADLALGWMPGDHSAQQRHHREIARRLADRLPERERLLVDGTYRMLRNPDDPTVLENPIEEAVRQYPTDAEAWYLLAEAYFHETFLMRPEEVEETFARAIELDSTFAPYRIHHIEFALYRGDSAQTARRIAEYRAVADPEEPVVRGFEFALRVWFTDSLTRRTLLDSLLAAPAGTLLPIGPPPSSPQTLRVQEVALRSLLKALDGPKGGFLAPASMVLRDLGRVLASQGRLVEAREHLRHPDLVGTDQWRCLLAEFDFIGIPVAESELRQGMGDPGREAGSDADAFCGALLATTLGERIPFQRGRDLLESRGETRFVGLAEAYWMWKQEGALERAAYKLRTTGGPNEAHYWTFWLGEIYRELGRDDEAEEAYLALMHPLVPFLNYPLAWYRLAKIYDARGDTARARQTWEGVAAAWANADPELQPRVAEARRRLAALR